ncbi:hypothetical protein IAT38_001952 [Cryptococcus sp. DSM 104549]
MIEKRKRESSPLVHKCRWDYCSETFTSFDDWEIHFEVDHMSELNPVDLTGRYKRQKADGRWYILPVGEGYRPSQELPLDGSQSTGGDITMSTVTSLHFSQPQFSQPEASQLRASMTARDCMPTHMILPPRSSPELDPGHVDHVEDVAHEERHGGGGVDGEFGELGGHGEHGQRGEHEEHGGQGLGHVGLEEAGDHGELGGMDDIDAQEEHDMTQYLNIEADAAELDAAGPGSQPETQSQSQSQPHSGDIQSSLGIEQLRATPPDPTATNLSPRNTQSVISQPQTNTLVPATQSSFRLPTPSPTGASPTAGPATASVYPKLPGELSAQPSSTSTPPFPMCQPTPPSPPWRGDSPVVVIIDSSSSELQLSHTSEWHESSSTAKPRSSQVGKDAESSQTQSQELSQDPSQDTPTRSSGSGSQESGSQTARGPRQSNGSGNLTIEFGSANTLTGEAGGSPATKRAEKIGFGFGQRK